MSCFGTSGNDVRRYLIYRASIEEPVIVSWEGENSNTKESEEFTTWLCVSTGA